MLLGKEYRKHVERQWEDVKKESRADELGTLRMKIYRALQDLTLCAQLEPENHLRTRSDKIPAENVLAEETIKPFLMALLDQREDPHEKPKRIESKEERAARKLRQRRLGALLVEIGARECLRWVPPGAIGESAMHDAIRGRNVLMELGRG